MRNGALILACAMAAGFGLAMPKQAEASCQSACVNAYNRCINMGGNPANCEALLDSCLATCRGYAGQSSAPIWDAQSREPQSAPLPMKPADRRKDAGKPQTAI